MFWEKTIKQEVMSLINKEIDIAQENHTALCKTIDQKLKDDKIALEVDAKATKGLMLKNAVREVFQKLANY